jgi:hypothetical protein
MSVLLLLLSVLRQQWEEDPASIGCFCPASVVGSSPGFEQ